MLVAKLLVLNRDLPGFAACVGLLDALLQERWDDVHPRGPDGDFAIRMAALESLDDLPPVVFPLQYLPLTNHRRLGPLSYRSWMIANGEAKPREGEAILDRAAIESALAETELAELVETRGQLQALQARLRGIRDICVDRAGGDRAAKLEKLPGLVDKILALVDEVVVKRDPSLAPAEPQEPDGAASGTSTIPTGAVASTRDVADALAAIGRYFARSEPSSPALLLVRQAEQLMGKSFLEVMRVLMPNHMEQAAIQIGKDQQIFDLPIARLSELAEAQPAAEPDAADERSRAGAAAAGSADARRRDPSAGADRNLLSARRALEPGSVPDRARAQLCAAGFPQPAEGSPARRRLEGLCREHQHADAAAGFTDCEFFSRAFKPAHRCG